MCRLARSARIALAREWSCARDAGDSQPCIVPERLLSPPDSRASFSTHFSSLLQSFPSQQGLPPAKPSCVQAFKHDQKHD
eukprot:365431-Chlamydomonas_euryale.AAC.12